MTISTFTRIIVIALAVFIAVCGLQAHVTQANTADQLWNKYRVRLIQLLQGRFKSYTKGIKAFGSNTNIDQTTLHIVTDPVDALWTKNLDELTEFAGFVPNWSTSWNARFSKDNLLTEKYQQLLYSHKDKQTGASAFARFMKVTNKGMVQSPHHPTLAQFVASTKGKPPNAFQFTVEESKGSVTINTPWGKRTSKFTKMKSIVRSLEKKAAGNKALWDDVWFDEEEHVQYSDAQETAHADEESGQIELDDFLMNYDFEQDDNDASALASSSFLFRRRRRRRKPQPKPKPIIIKSKKFHMNMKAQGLAGIVVGAPSIDHKFIRENKSKFSGKWFGKNGQFALMPSIVWVAMRPHVVLRLSESEFKVLQKSWTSKSSLGLAIAGTLFRNKNFKQAALQDSTILSDMFPEDVLNDMRQNDDLMDEASFVVKSVGVEGDEEIVLEEGRLEDFDTSFFSSQDDDTFSSGYGVPKYADYELDDLLEMQDDEAETLASSEFLFRRRRRRRRRPRPRPKPPQIKEKVYEARFESKSNYPQVLAVTSDIL